MIKFIKWCDKSQRRFLATRWLGPILCHLYKEDVEDDCCMYYYVRYWGQL